MEQKQATGWIVHAPVHEGTEIVNGMNGSVHLGTTTEACVLFACTVGHLADVEDGDFILYLYSSCSNLMRRQIACGRRVWRR